MSLGWVTVGVVAAFAAALITSLITAYVALYARTYGAGRRLIEANAGRELAEAELAGYEEAIHSWRHYAQGLEAQVADAHASINHLTEEVAQLRRGADALYRRDLDPDDAAALPCLPPTPQPTVEEVP